ncbi:heavy metal-binding domain-containing protein [Streptomyces antarcticus]|uniref:heavy metal-binding domain-containing protein n=1 Tax=Streptomyces antarcticus TaxID=2996458 RepID=UPI003B834FC5
MRSCVYHVAHQCFAQALNTTGRNVEIETFTQALYDARELAMSRMQAEGKALDAEGIVAVQLRQHSHSWESHTTEFFAIGTAVRPLRHDHVIDRPTLVLGLDARAGSGTAGRGAAPGQRGPEPTATRRAADAAHPVSGAECPRTVPASKRMPVRAAHQATTDQSGVRRSAVRVMGPPSRPSRGGPSRAPGIRPPRRSRRRR